MMHEVTPLSSNNQTETTVLGSQSKHRSEVQIYCTRKPGKTEQVILKISVK